MKSLVIAVGIVALATFQAIAQPKYSNSACMSLSIQTAKGSSNFDANYKHQAGVHDTETTSHATIKTEESIGYEANYKRSVGRRKERKHTCSVKESPSMQRTDGNYKHQFPAR